MPNSLHTLFARAIMRFESVHHLMLVVLAVFPMIAVAAPGALDPTFGNGGTVRRNISVAPADDIGQFMLRQPDGKIILEGTCATEEGVLRTCMVRYLANGSLDATFNGTGKLVTSLDSMCSWHVAGVSLNSKIYGFGQCGVAGFMTRMNDDGSLDTTFGVNGLSPLLGGMVPSAIAVQGVMLLVAGACPGSPSLSGCLQRLTSDGQLDTTFGGTGTATSRVGGSIALNANKIVLAGSCANPLTTSICVTQFLADGALDQTFSGTGSGVYSIAIGNHTVVGVLLDGDRIVVGAACGASPALSGGPNLFCAARIAASGLLDTSFNGNGAVTLLIAQPYNIASGIALDGSRIVIAGGCTYNPEHMCLARFNADGSLDTTLNGSGIVVVGSFVATYSSTTANAIQVDGAGIILGGSCRDQSDWDLCVVRLTQSGALDFSFNGTGRAVTPLGEAPRRDILTALTRHADGKIAAVGFCNIGTAEYFNDQLCVAKFNTDGSPDTNFKGNGRAFTPLGGISRAAALVTVGDKMIVAGSCTAVNEYNYDFCVVRYLANGELDTSFNGTGVVKVDFGGGHDYPTAMLVDGTRILVIGSCNFSGDAIYRFCALRLNENGSFDLAFGNAGKSNNAAWGVAADGGSVVMVNGKFYISTLCQGAGLGATRYFCTLRLNADGSPDLSFGIGGRAVTNIVAGGNLGVSAALNGGAFILAGICSTGSGQHACLLRVLLDGTVDTAFGNNADAVASLFWETVSVVVVNGRTMLTGSGNCGGSSFCLARFASNGMPDTSFGIGGMSVASDVPPGWGYASAIALDGDRVLLGGTCSSTSADFCLSRVQNQMTPSAPLLLRAVGGQQKISATFAPPIFDGGAAISEYRLSCDNGAVTATGVASPLQIAGLTNGTTYQCSLSAVSVNGVGTPTTFVASPTASPIALLKVLSRKLHGAAGTYEIIIDHTQTINGVLTVEPRSSAVPHLVVFQFDGAIASVGIPVISDIDGISIGSATASINGTAVEVQLGGTPGIDSRRVTVRLPGVNANQGIFSSSVAFLVGDVNGSRTVDAADVSEIKARSGQVVDLTNFRHDLNASGVVNAADISGGKARIGAVLR